MTIAILADEVQKEEWLSRDTPEEVEFIWVDSVSSFLAIEADAWFDLQFTPDPERMNRLRQLKGKTLVVDAVSWAGKQIGDQWIRIAAWPTLLRRPIIEVALTNPEQAEKAKQLFGALQWRYQLVPDTCGLVVPRILAMMINEAYHTFGSGVSSKEEINIAMKLGTNYPFGPFEWSEKIGIEKIYELLKRLDRTDNRYDIAPALAKEINP